LEVQEVKKLISIIKKDFINLYRILYELDPVEAEKFQNLNHYYFDKAHCKSEKCDKDHHHDHDHSHSHKHEEHSGHKHDHDHEAVMKEFFIPENELSFTQKLLYDLYKDYKFEQILPEILNELGKKFNNIKQGGIRDKLGWDEKAEEFVLIKVLSEGLTKEIVNRLRKEMQRDQLVESKQPMLLATPQSWYEKFPKIKLDFLTSDIIKTLFDQGYVIKSNFVDEVGYTSALDNEVKYFYHEGRFEEPVVSESKTRNDKLLTFSFTDVDPKSSRALYHLCRSLTAFPFEMNLKASIYSQVSEVFQLSYFSENESFQHVHYDSSFKEKFDNGKKISALYVFSENSKAKLKLVIHKKESTEVLEERDLEVGSVCLLKSRVIPYALKDIPAKTFILRYWVNGPADSANQTM